MSNKSSKQSKAGRFFKAPLRVLIKARDFYIQSLMICDGRVGQGTVMGCPTGQLVCTVPRSFSVNSSKSNEDQDLRELIRAASARSYGNKLDLDLLRKQAAIPPRQQQPAGGPNNMPRSCSVGIGRIDEDSPCEFGEVVKVNTDLYPRSRSYAVSKRTGLL